MKRAGDIVVSKGMLWGAFFFVLLALLPQILKIFYKYAVLDAITIGIGWYAYLVVLGFIVSFVVGVMSHGKKGSGWFARTKL